jgi:hypothetical protein
MSGMSEVTTTNSPTGPRKIRFGVMFARIGTLQKYKLLEDCHPDEKGDVVHLEVKDISRLDKDIRADVRWFCTHPECSGKRFPTKDQLVAAHADQKILTRNEEKHLCMGIVELPPVKARPEVRNARGQIRKEAVGMWVYEERKDEEGRPVTDQKGNIIVDRVLKDLPARLELFSDEEWGG